MVFINIIITDAIVNLHWASLPVAIYSICTPDDGWDCRPKHVELRRIKTQLLHLVGLISLLYRFVRRGWRSHYSSSMTSSPLMIPKDIQIFKGASHKMFYQNMVCFVLPNRQKDPKNIAVRVSVCGPDRLHSPTTKQHFWSLHPHPCCTTENVAAKYATRTANFWRCDGLQYGRSCWTKYRFC